MRKVEVINIEKEVDYDLSSLFEQYTLYSRMESEAKKKKEAIKKILADKFTEKDSLGNYWINTESGRFKKALKISREINPIMADPILKRLHIYDKVVNFVPEYDLDMLTNYIKDGTINKEDLTKMFKEKESYAIYAVEKEKAQEEEIPQSY